MRRGGKLPDWLNPKRLLHGRRERAEAAKEQRERDVARAELLEELLQSPGWRAFEQMALDLIQGETERALLVFPIQPGKDPTGALAHSVSIAQRSEVSGMRRVLRLPREHLQFVRDESPSKETEGAA